MKRILLLILLFSGCSFKGTLRTELKEDGMTRIFIIENVNEIMGYTVSSQDITDNRMWSVSCGAGLLLKDKSLVVTYGELVPGCVYWPGDTRPRELKKGVKYKFGYISPSNHIPSLQVWFVH